MSQPSDTSRLEQLLIAAAVFGVVTGITLWVLIDHQEDAARIWNKATERMLTWLD